MASCGAAGLCDWFSATSDMRGIIFWNLLEWKERETSVFLNCAVLLTLLTLLTPLAPPSPTDIVFSELDMQTVLLHCTLLKNDDVCSYKLPSFVFCPFFLLLSWSPIRILAVELARNKPKLNRIIIGGSSSSIFSYGLDDRGVGVRIPVGVRIFTSPNRPDRLWVPPNLLSNGYRGPFPGGKAAGA
jgi:hypothetical protein